jgi:hypothetical protein
MILMVVDHFTKMPYFTPIKNKDSPTGTWADLENVWRYHGFPADIVSEWDSTFTGQFLTDL